MFGIAATAGMIHGVTIEEESGYLLARTRVELIAERQPGQAPQSQAVMSERSGQFSFASLPPGRYLVRASRAGFAPHTHGAIPYGAAGKPITVAADAAVFVEIRLKRLPAISGRVVDENRVGIAGITVIAYPAQIPLRIAAQAVTDDRGGYRVGPLAPGKYYVRTAAHRLEDGLGLLPTFSPLAVEARESRIVEIALERDGRDVEIQPQPGNLISIRGKAMGCALGRVDITLSSDTGRQQTSTYCGGPFAFENLPPGRYELLGEAPNGNPPLGAFDEFTAYRDRDRGIDLRTLPTVQLQTKPAGVLAPLNARRRDLAGVGESVTLSRRPARLAPGYWEIFAPLSPEYYLDAVDSSPRVRSRVATPGGDERFEVFVPDGGSCSSRPRSPSGRRALPAASRCAAAIRREALRSTCCRKRRRRCAGRDRRLWS
ncbi:MAG: MSCRAMM family protein [Bryobacteraceae bacterium]